MYVYMRASLEFFSHFDILKLLFLSIFFGSSDTLSVQMTCMSAYMLPTDFQMYRQNSEKALLWGGGGGAIAPLAPPTPPLATLML